jgi:hypothetical protein
MKGDERYVGHAFLTWGACKTCEEYSEEKGCKIEPPELDFDLGYSDVVCTDWRKKDGSLAETSKDAKDA